MWLVSLFGFLTLAEDNNHLYVTLQQNYQLAFIRPVNLTRAIHDIRVMYNGRTWRRAKQRFNYKLKYWREQQCISAWQFPTWAEMATMAHCLYICRTASARWWLHFHYSLCGSWRTSTTRVGRTLCLCLVLPPEPTPGCWDDIIKVSETLLVHVLRRWRCAVEVKDLSTPYT